MVSAVIWAVRSAWLTCWLRAITETITEMPNDPPILRNSASRLDPSGLSAGLSAEKAMRFIGANTRPRPSPGTKLARMIGRQSMSADQVVISQSEPEAIP